ncbi:hypothetical protein HHE94_11990 [Pseudoalteromonas arctica]|uniref:Orphan protein n=1 Tax=Pseudoalteromonas arctica TaxID=394751 RepID=A0AAP6Y3D6_9GAMM|nr:hypothetical protein [Pseudoalteromonas arctica]NMP03422.1 hypothetical protein [Pseudoalteromonas arctica]
MDLYASSQQSTCFPERIQTLLDKIELSVNDNNAIEAQSSLNTLNIEIRKWCESSEPPNTEQLQVIQLQISTILVIANNIKNESSKAIINHKKSGRAIKAYKAT